jgi:hypothetical protein
MAALSNERMYHPIHGELRVMHIAFTPTIWTPCSANRAYWMASAGGPQTHSGALRAGTKVFYPWGPDGSAIEFMQPGS